jgi:hypothetical protein
LPTNRSCDSKGTTAEGKPIDGVDRLPVHEQEIDHAQRQARLGDVAEDEVEQPRIELARPTVRFAALALAEDDSCTPAPFRHEGPHQLRRMLQVGIHDHHRVALGVFQPRGNGDLLAEIAAEGNGGKPRIGGVQVANAGQRPIGRPVVDEQH